MHNLLVISLLFLPTQVHAKAHAEVSKVNHRRDIQDLLVNVVYKLVDKCFDWTPREFSIQQAELNETMLGKLGMLGAPTLRRFEKLGALAPLPFAGSVFGLDRRVRPSLRASRQALELMQEAEQQLKWWEEAGPEDSLPDALNEVGGPEFDRSARALVSLDGVNTSGTHGPVWVNRFAGVEPDYPRPRQAHADNERWETQRHRDQAIGIGQFGPLHVRTRNWNLPIYGIYEDAAHPGGWRQIRHVAESQGYDIENGEATVVHGEAQPADYSRAFLEGRYSLLDVANQLRDDFRGKGYLEVPGPNPKPRLYWAKKVPYHEFFGDDLEVIGKDWGWDHITNRAFVKDDGKPLAEWGPFPVAVDRTKDDYKSVIEIDFTDHGGQLMRGVAFNGKIIWEDGNTWTRVGGFIPRARHPFDTSRDLELYKLAEGDGGLEPLRERPLEPGINPF